MKLQVRTLVEALLIVAIAGCLTALMVALVFGVEQLVSYFV